MAAKNGCIQNTEYALFGRGKRTLLLLPGLGDGLRSMKGMALPLSLLYRSLAKDFRVYVFSRRKDLSKGMTTRDMARDLKAAMDALRISKADVVGVSMGGMIAQWLAADYPERVEKLVLTVSCPSPNPILEEAVGEWIRCAKAGDHRGLMDSNLRRIYSEAYYRKNRWMIPLIGKLTKPQSYERFLIQAEACRAHDAKEALPKILAPTLVVGGERDLCLSGEASRELAERIRGAKLRMYPQWGHGLYEEEKEFLPLVRKFLLEEVE